LQVDSYTERLLTEKAELSGGDPAPADTVEERDAAGHHLDHHQTLKRVLCLVFTVTTSSTTSRIFAENNACEHLLHWSNIWQVQ